MKEITILLPEGKEAMCLIVSAVCVENRQALVATKACDPYETNVLKFRIEEEEK